MGSVCMYTCHMMSLASTIQQGALYTHWTYNTEHILLSHFKYSSCAQHATWAYRPHIFGYIHQNTTACNFYFMLLQNVPQTNMAIKFDMYAIYAQYLMSISQ